MTITEQQDKVHSFFEDKNLENSKWYRNAFKSKQ